MNKYLHIVLLTLILATPMTADALENAKTPQAQNPAVECPYYQARAGGNAAAPCPMTGQPMMNHQRGWMMTDPQGRRYNAQDWDGMHRQMHQNMPAMHMRGFGMMRDDNGFNR